METMAEPGLLPQPHHSSHAYLAGAGNPGASGVHPGFFQGQPLETPSSSPPPPVPVSGDNRQSYLSPVTSSQGYPPFPYKQQLHQTSASMQQAHSVGTMEFPSAYRNVPEGFGRNPDSRTFGFSRSSSFPHSSSPFHPSVQAGLMPGFRDPKQRPPGTSANPDSVQAERDGERKELSAGARRGPQSPFMKEPPEGYRDQQGPSMSDQLGFNPPEKDHEIRADIGKEFLPPDQREKQASRYGAFNGNAAFRDGGDFGPVKSKGQPAFLDNIMGNFRSSPGDIDAEPMAYDAEDFSPREMSGFPGRNIGLKSREPLARSASHDVRSVAWGSDLDLGRDERDADGRPLRSLTLDPSLHRRHPRPELYMVSGYGDRDDVCSQVPDRRLSLPQQDVMAGNRTNSSREQVKGQPDRVMTSPAKPTRRLSDHGQSIKDAESAAIPQQSPNRPVPHNASASAKILPERPSQLTNSSGLYPREGKPESDMTSSETLKSDQAPSLSQVSPRSGNSNIKPTSGSPADMPEFTSPKPGEHTNKASSVGKLGGGEDVDDRNGDPKSYTNGNSVDGDDSSRRLDLQSHSLSGKADNIGNISGNNNDDGDDARFYDNTVNTRDRSPEGDTRKGEGSRDDYRSFIAKRELFSEDEDEEGSQDTGSRRGQYLGDSSPRSMSPPSPDSSMTYPSPYSHPFFSPSRGMNPALPFGSQRGALNHDAGPGFPFGKDFHGRFPMAGMGGAPEMGMGGLTRMGPQRNDSSHHRFMNPMGLLEDENKDIYFCHLCSYSGKTKSDFDAHMSVHFEFNCPHCDYTSRTEGRLKRHIKDFHSDDSSRRSMPGRPKIYRCKQCPFSAKEKDKFWEHARSHIKEDKLLQCPKCSFVTEYKHHLEYHLRNHFGSKPFKCTKCNYSCVNKSMLNSHMKSHTNVYQYRCAECTYATKYCHSLKLHLKKYGHKPATVLNQDGSLPQGLDVDASGLSVATKRGPPRGPRGPRKDKSGSGGGPGGDPYLNQLFGMPPVPMGVPGMGAHTMNPISPMLNGMMPFWPMLPHGPGGMAGHAQAPHHPSPQPGMLPGMGSLPHQMRLPGPDAGMMPPHRINHDGAHPPDFKNSSIPAGMHRGPAIGRPVSNDGEDPRNGGNSEEVSRRESVNMVHGDMNKQDYAACNLCDFIAENTHALCMHYIDVHKEEPGRDFHRDFGMSRDGRERRAAFPFPRDRENDRGRNMMERGGLETDKRRMSEPPTDTVPENDHQYNDLHRRNSLAGLLPKNPDSLRANNNRYGGMEEDNRASWQTGPAFPERERSVRMDVCHSGHKEAPGEEDDTSKALGKDDRDTNILHQMTLKFGNGAPMEREDLARETRSPLVESPGGAASGSEEGGHLTNVHSHRSANDRGRGGRPHKETPLDLTKPKPDSPSDFESNSPAEYGEDAGDKRDFFNENARGGKEDTGKSLSKVTEILLKKRPYPEDFQDGENKSSEMSRIDKGSAIMPRKRSRKGKAYKLDTICLKLQEQQSSPLDSDGNESDMEMGFSGFQPLVPPSDLVEAREVKNNDKHQGKEDVSPRELGGQASGDDPNIIIEPPVNADNDGVDSDGTEDYTNDEVKDDDFDDFKEVGEVTRVIARRGEEDNFHPKPLPTDENIEGEEAEPSSFASDRAENVPNAAEVADSSEVGKNKTDEGLDDSEETDFEKLQRSLKLLNSGEDPTDTDIQTEDWRQNSEGIKDVMNESKEYSQLEDSSRKSTGSSNHDGSDIMIKTEESELSKSQEHQHMNTSECLSDKENSDGQSEIPPSSLMTSGDSGIEKRSLSPKDSSSTRLEQFSFDSDEEIDQVDLIHTVLENRKKPLPPAVRRGTELAWKLLNDPVNPVTSLPIPVVTSTAPKSASDGEPRDRTQSASPSLPAASASRTSQPRPDSPSGAVPPPLHLAAHPVGQPTPNSPRPMMGPSSSSPNLIRNGVRQHTTAYRQLHPFQQHHPSSHLPQHQHYQQTPPPLPRNHHPLFPPPPHYGHHPSLVSSAGPHAMKSPASSASSMPIPLPPTPMAFIPPTNRMDRVPDQTQSPGTQTGPGVMPHVKPQLPISQQQKSELYECTYCDLTFRDCVMYTVHMGYHSNRNPFKCNSCGIVCRDKVEFFLHIARSPHA